MIEFITFILGLGLVLFLWSGIGHLMWLAASFFFRLVFGVNCPQCGYRRVATECPQCAKQRQSQRRSSEASSAPSVKTDLAAAKRLIDYARFNRWLSDEQVASLERLINRLSARIDGSDPIPPKTQPVQAKPITQAKPPAEAKQPVSAFQLAEPEQRPSSPNLQIPSPRVAPTITSSFEPHPLDRPDEPPVAIIPRAPLQTRVTANLLKTFMEQSNIRWVELISATLIVVCSVGLVISLWSTLSSTSRFFPSLVFMLATIAVHGAGQYTLRKWKLRTTSRGILHIGLMLIPLAMLVGILLSRREGGLPALTLTTAAVILFGTVVYGGLAITACKSLFSRRWPVVALHTIVASLTLLPINYLSERNLLISNASVWSLVPLVLVSMWAALVISQSSHRLVGGASGVIRWMAGSVTQCLFGALVVLGFWLLQVRGSAEQTELISGWWIASGVLAAAWASWGWSVSLSQWRLAQPTNGAFNASELRSSRGVASSWLVVAAWFIATSLSLFLLTAIWHASDARLALVTLLVTISAWWLAQGWFCNLRISLLAGSLSAIVAVTLVIEQSLAPAALMSAVQWLSFSRIATLSVVGLATSLAASFWSRKQHDKGANARRYSISRVTKASLSDVGQQFQIGGACIVAIAACLTIVASLVPLGETPYGGNWAAILLCSYGVMALFAGIGLSQLKQPHPLMQFVLPLGQALLLLGVVRLCQTSPMLEETLAHLRPTRSWAIGTAGLALLWSSLAAGLKIFSDRRQQLNIDWLANVACALSLVTAAALWSASDQLWLASSVGWYLPLSCLAVFIAWRRGAWRETTLVTLCVWVGSLVIMLGLRHQWWEQLGLAASSATLIAALTLVVIAFEALVVLWHRQSSSITAVREVPTQAVEVSPASSNWIIAEMHWGSQTLLTCGWAILILSLLVPTTVNISLSLGATTTTSQLSDFVARALGGTGFSLTIAALVALTTASIWLGRSQKSVWLQNSVAIAPLVLAMTLAAWFSPAHSLAAALWSLSAWILLSDLILPLFGVTWAARSQAAWQQMVAAKENFPKSEMWLVLGRALAISLLILGSLLFVIVSLSTELLQSSTVASSTWFAHIRTLLVVLGPVLMFSTVRWMLSVWNAESPTMTTSAILLTALFSGLLAAIGLIDYSQLRGSHPWASMAVVSLQTTGLVSAACAWLTIGFTASRNFLGLRQMLRGKVATRELLSKTLKGSRWQRAEKASWNVSRFGLPLVVVLALAAAWLVITYPIRLPATGNMLERLGGPAVAVTVFITLSLTGWLSFRRGLPKFGLLAIGHGLIAPTGAAAYANWLMAVPARSFVTAQRFEPFRAIIVLWLLVLTIGLIVRIVASLRRRTFSQWGEAAWVILAVFVGALSIVSTTQDPNWVWPFSELSALALITLLSSVIAQQPWRAHVAAVLAAVGVSAWSLHRLPGSNLHEVWLILFGPVSVAIFTIIFRGVWNRHQTSEQLPSSANRSTRFSVEQSVSLLYPFTAMVLSFLWMAGRPILVSSSTSLLPAILLLSLCGLSLAIARLWEPLPAKRGLGVYLNLIACGLVAAMSISAWGELPALQSRLVWLASGLSAMAVMAGLLRELVRESSPLGAQLKLGSVTTVDRYRHALHWMPIVHSVAAMLALVPCILLVLAFEQRELRIAATVLPFIGAIAILPIAIERGREAFRYCGLILISTSLILLWWADLPNAWAVTNIEGSWIFVQRTFAALVALGCLYPVLAHLLRHKQEWVRPLMNMGWATLTLGIATGIVMLTGSIGKQWDQVAESIDIGSKLMTITAWIAVVARLLQFAARPHSTDRNAPVQLRKAAVFGAEFAIAFMCAATYFHFPHLFAGIFLNWWPIVLFGIAMLSAGVGEWMRRLGQTVIADPVQQSSLLLPIIPLAGVWFFRAEDAQLAWNEWGRYALLLLSGAGLYGLHGWARNSVGLRALSGLMTLCAFWSYLHSHPDLRFLEHPQFWLLPPSLAALVFAELNRNRLENGVVVATRYTAILIAYLSSTSEIFLKAFEGELWQPLLLLVLALAGVAAGIVLRVRAFLFCGAAFTMVALLGMVWHAQQAIGQVWPWWAFGIATGICLIVCLGYFEKNRPRVISYLDQFRQWEK